MGKLTDAVKNNNLKEVQRLLDGQYKNSRRIDEEQDANGRSPLLMAAQQGHIAAIEALVQAGANVNQADKYGFTPLYGAASRGHVAAIAALVKAMADVNQATKDGRTPLYVVAEKGHTAAIEALVQAGADVNQADRHGWTPLYVAAQQGQLAAIEALIKAMADVNQATKDGRTPLYGAASRKHVAAIAALVKAMADVNQAMKDGATPLWIAAEMGHLAAIEALVKANANVNVNQANKNGATPLWMAAQNGHATAIEALVKAKANVNQANNNGFTPLYIAAQKGHLAAIETLVKAGAKVNQADKDGLDFIPLYAAAQNGHLAAIEALVKAGADVNQAMKDGATPLYIAAKNGHTAAIEALLKAGADVNAKVTEGYNKGKTSLAIAKKEGHTEVVRLLETHIQHLEQLKVQKHQEAERVRAEEAKQAENERLRLADIQKQQEERIRQEQLEGKRRETEKKPLAQKTIALSPVAEFKPERKALNIAEESKPISPTISSFSFTLQYSALEIGKELGRGAFGIVYQGVWKKHIEVAVKQLILTKPSPDALAEFQQEMNLMNNLRCPQIVQLYGVYTEPTYGIVMEYMPNGSLYTVLHSKQPLEWSVRTSIAVDITKGVAFLHSENILHRDLKSLNVLLDKHMNAKLTDFGLAKIKTETASTASSNNNQVAGTLLWMAPELFKPKAKCTQKSDMYGLGMTLWELASRKKPFENALNPNIAVHWVMDGEREEIPTDTPPKVSKLITFCWNADAAKRPTADEAVKQLISAELKQEQTESANFSYRGPFDSGLR